MTSLLRRPREVYRIYEVEEFFAEQPAACYTQGSAGPTTTCHAQGSARATTTCHARDSAGPTITRGSRLLPRAAGAAVLLLVTGAAVALTVIAASYRDTGGGTRRARRPAAVASTSPEPGRAPAATRVQVRAVTRVRVRVVRRAPRASARETARAQRTRPHPQAHAHVPDGGRGRVAAGLARSPTSAGVWPDDASASGLTAQAAIAHRQPEFGFER